MTFTSRLYLDFDGVLNAKDPQHALIKVFSIPIEGSRNLAPVNHITFSPTVVEVIDYFRTFYNVELVWLSTWNDRNDVLKLSSFLKGVEGGRVIEANLNQSAKNKKEWTQWKADAIIADQKTDPKRFIWVDDNAHRFHGDTVVLEASHVESLLVTPESLWGLTIDDLNTMEAFFNKKN